MSPETKPLGQLNEEAIHVLVEELGVVDTAQFLRQFTTGTGDHTKERRERLADPSLDELLGKTKERHGE